MDIKYGVSYIGGQDTYKAYMSFIQDDHQRHVLTKDVPKDVHEEYMYNPFNKKYELCTFHSPLTFNDVHKASLRKTWKSLVEQGWEKEDV